MVEFKIVVNDTKDGKAHNVQISGHHANSLIGKKIGDEVDGIFISLPGYKLEITGGTDKNGFTMRRDFPGVGRRKLLLSKGLGFNSKEKGLRKKKSVRGNTINQINAPSVIVLLNYCALFLLWMHQAMRL